MKVAYFKREQVEGKFHYYKVYGGPGKTKNGYQEVINFLNATPLIYIEHNSLFDPQKPDAPFDLTGTWDTYEVGIPIAREEYELAYKLATDQDFEIK